MSSDDDSEAMFQRVQRVPTVDSDDDDDDDDDNDGLTLRQTAALACKRIDIGTAVLPKPLFTPDVEDMSSSQPLAAASAFDVDYYSTERSHQQPTRYAALVQAEFNAVVIEHHLKWAPLVHSEPGPLDNGRPSERFGRYDFHHADSIVDWCRAHGIAKVKGHVLVWHVTTPKFVEQLPPHEVREQLKRHIFTCMAHFRGRISTWDVVNEALAPDGTLAETVFYQKLGPRYIEDCFRWAHEADPTATLLYNDNKVEGIHTAKADGFYNLLADLKAKGVPVHGCGIQAHFNAAGTGASRPPTPRQVKQQIRRLGALGLSVNISEMDVRVSKLPAPAAVAVGTATNTATTTTTTSKATPAAAAAAAAAAEAAAAPLQTLRDVAQRQIYHDILAAALSEPALDGIWLWGFTDRHTWVHSFYYDDEPCILDESYQRKEAYYGVRDALRSLTPGHVVGGSDGSNNNNTSGTASPSVWLESDVDTNGNAWGHLWMLPDSDEDRIELTARGGDARPDWEQEPVQRPLDDDDDDDDKSGDDDTEDVESQGNGADLNVGTMPSTDSDYLPPIL